MCFWFELISGHLPDCFVWVLFLRHWFLHICLVASSACISSCWFLWIILIAWWEWYFYRGIDFCTSCWLLHVYSIFEVLISVLLPDCFIWVGFWRAWFLRIFLIALCENYFWGVDFCASYWLLHVSSILRYWFRLSSLLFGVFAKFINKPWKHFNHTKKLFE